MSENNLKELVKQLAMSIVKELKLIVFVEKLAAWLRAKDA